MKVSYLFLILVFCSLTALGQDKFLPGYYISAKSDTIRGLIRNRLDYSGQFEFRDSLRMESKQISIGDVSDFGFTSGSKYRAINFALSDSLKPVFAKLLFDGSVDLFKKNGRFYADGGGRNKFVFYKDKNSKVEEAQESYRKNVGYFNVLFEYCPNILKEAANTKIRDEGLIQLLEAYHSCVQRKFNKHNPIIGRVYNIGGYIGFTSTVLSFDKAKILNSFLEESRFNVSRAISFGAIFLYHAKKDQPTFAIQNELNFNSAEFDATSFYTSSGGGNSTEESTITKIKYSRLALRVGFRFTGRSNYLNPYFAFGAAFAQTLSINAKTNRTLKINESTEVTELESIPNINGIGAWASLGVKKKVGVKSILFIDLNYDFSSINSGGKVLDNTLRIGYLF
jgi:hypothetical protein